VETADWSMIDLPLTSVGWALTWWRTKDWRMLLSCPISLVATNLLFGSKLDAYMSIERGWSMLVELLYNFHFLGALFWLVESIKSRSHASCMDFNEIPVWSIERKVHRPIIVFWILIRISLVFYTVLWCTTLRCFLARLYHRTEKIKRIMPQYNSVYA